MNYSRDSRRRLAIRILGVVVILGIAALLVPGGLAGKGGRGKKPRADRPTNPDELRVVDCLLPAQVRKMGRRATMLKQRRPARLTALDCQIRGGEYVEYDRASYATALEVWLAAAKAGDASAQYYVGEIYEQGLGTDPDYVKAAEWYRKSADRGHAPAQINLGFLYEKGLGVEQDRLAAMEWYRKSSGVSGLIMQDSELEAIRRELAEAQARKEEAQQKLTALGEELDAERRALEAERSSSERSAERVAELESRVSSLTVELDSQQTAISRMEKAQAKHDIEGPLIEVIDVSAVRGAPAGQPENLEELLGRVVAPAGLTRFLVDDREEPVDEEGYFKVAVEDRRTITFTAIDAQGKRVELVHDLSGSPQEDDDPSAGRTSRKKKKGKAGFGSYHALIIGNNEYGFFPDLKSAVKDAQEIAELLETRYGFRTSLILDASYVDMLSAFNELRENLTEKDNLLIYYAGHGEIDTATGQGYWLPVDAEPDKSEWISSREVSRQLDTLRANHVLVIADSCYSGALTRSSIPQFARTAERDRDSWLADVKGSRSRTALTSGGLQPVLDVGGGGHSVFARVVLDVLSGNAEVLETSRLWAVVRARVKSRTKMFGRVQVPEYAAMGYAGHGGGEFFFVPDRG